MKLPGRPLGGVLLLVAALLAGEAGCATRGADPLEPWNRGAFAFNEAADRWVVEPVATGWDTVVPELVQKGLGNFFTNLGMPVVMVNDLLQLKPLAAFDDLMHLVYNTVFGLGGVFDIVTREGIPLNDEDFGQTLGVWGVPPGPYLVLPFFGPSSPRDAVGLAVDSAGTVPGYFLPFWITATGRGVDLVNYRASLLEEIRQSREESLDFYIFVRNAYVQNRIKKVADDSGLAPPPEDDEDLYYFDDEEDEDVEASE